MIKKIISPYVVLLPLLAPFSSLSAAVTFNFIYEDPSDFSAESVADIEAAGATLGSYFNETATVNIKVDANITGGLTLAGASSLYNNSNNSFNRGAVGAKIIHEIDGDITGLGYEGTLSVNLTSSINWGFGSSVGANQSDFQSTMLHELSHTVGFSSTIGEDGSSFFGSNSWYIFDYFVGDSTGVLIDRDSNDLDIHQDRWDAASVGGAGEDGLVWYGENAIAANGGEAVYLYSPANWSDGSSGSHLDDAYYTDENYVLEALAGRGMTARTLSAIEVGMLKDLGFDTVSVIPEPSTTSVLALSVFAFMLRRKRVNS